MNLHLRDGSAKLAQPVEKHHNQSAKIIKIFQVPQESAYT